MKIATLYVILFLVTMTTVNCNGKKYKKLKAIDQISTDLKVGDQLSDFYNFWTVFRSAVMDKDTVTLQTLTNFPLIVRGYNDCDPVLKIELSEFIIFFNKCLNEQTYVDRVDATNLDHVKRVLDPKHTDELEIKEGVHWHRFGNIEFIKDSSGWKIFTIYTDTRE